MHIQKRELHAALVEKINSVCGKQQKRGLLRHHHAPVAEKTQGTLEVCVLGYQKRNQNSLGSLFIFFHPFPSEPSFWAKVSFNSPEPPPMLSSDCSKSFGDKERHLTRRRCTSWPPGEISPWRSLNLLSHRYCLSVYCFARVRGRSVARIPQRPSGETGLRYFFSASLLHSPPPHSPPLPRTPIPRPCRPHPGEPQAPGILQAEENRCFASGKEQKCCNPGSSPNEETLNKCTAGAPSRTAAAQGARSRSPARVPGGSSAGLPSCPSA